MAMRKGGRGRPLRFPEPLQTVGCKPPGETQTQQCEAGRFGDLCREAANLAGGECAGMDVEVGLAGIQTGRDRTAVGKDERGVEARGQGQIEQPQVAARGDTGGEAREGRSRRRHARHRRSRRRYGSGSALRCWGPADRRSSRPRARHGQWSRRQPRPGPYPERHSACPRPHPTARPCRRWARLASRQPRCKPMSAATALSWSWFSPRPQVVNRI